MPVVIQDLARSATGCLFTQLLVFWMNQHDNISLYPYTISEIITSTPFDQGIHVMHILHYKTPESLDFSVNKVQAWFNRL